MKIRQWAQLWTQTFLESTAEHRQAHYFACVKIVNKVRVSATVGCRLDEVCGRQTQKTDVCLLLLCSRLHRWTPGIQPFGSETRPAIPTCRHGLRNGYSITGLREDGWESCVARLLHLILSWGDKPQCARPGLSHGNRKAGKELSRRKESYLRLWGREQLHGQIVNLCSYLIFKF